MAICRTKCRSSRRISAGTSTTRTTAGVTSSISTRSRAISFIARSFLFRGLLERQHFVARIKIDHFAVLDDTGQVLAVLQDRDVGDRVLVPDGDVGKLTRRDLADLAIETHSKGVVARSGNNGFHGRVAAVLDENLKLLGVQLTVSGE